MWAQVGDRVRKLRMDRNLSRTQFGAMVGLSEAVVNGIERGLNQISGTAIAKICSATCVSADYILFGAVDSKDAAVALSGLSHEQIKISLDIIQRLAQLIHTENGNDALIQEVFLQQHSRAV